MLSGAGSLEAVFHGAGCAARALQRASPARVGSADGDRGRGVGAPHAAIVADGGPRAGNRAQGELRVAARPSGVVRATLRPLGGGVTGVARGSGAVAAGGHEGAQETAAGPQPGVAVPGVQDGDAAFPARARRALHEQPSGAGPADDEAAREELGSVAVGAGAAGSRHVVQRAVAGVEAGSQPHRDADARGGGAARQPALLAGARTRAIGSPRKVGPWSRCASPLQPSGSAHRRGNLGSYVVCRI